MQLQNLSDSQIEENQVKELNRLSVSYNKMLERLSEAFKIQRQFTENAAHELQTVGRDETIIVNALVDEVLADLEPLAQEKNIKLIGKCKDVNMVGSDILIYRLVYNLVENAIKYNLLDLRLLMKLCGYTMAVLQSYPGWCAGGSAQRLV